jgi:hypothetical protein
MSKRWLKERGMGMGNECCMFVDVKTLQMWSHSQFPEHQTMFLALRVQKARFGCYKPTIRVIQGGPPKLSPEEVQIKERSPN